MGAVIHVCLCLLVQFIFATYGQNVNTFDIDSDSVIIEAASDAKPKRDAKQFLLQPYGFPYYNLVPDLPQLPIVQAQARPSLLATTGTCYDSKGELGKCIAFRQCYPYFKLPEIGNFDAWLLGMYDTCSYYTSQGRQMFGVCCAHPPEPTSTTELPLEESDKQEESSNQEEPDSTSVNLPANGAKIPNWPPPLPTHPPDHTIPPLPTHPPSPGYPVLETTFSPPANVIPSKATVKPIIKPVTTRPTYKPTTKPTTTKPVYDLPTATCGAKNGFQDQGKIVGGHNAEVNEWPWIAALFNSGRQFCGGSLIDNVHILSAAHCVAHMSSWDVARLTVRLGDHNIKSNSETKHIEKRVKRVVRHRGFDSRTLYNDISILTLDSPVEFNSVIRPICLPSGGGRDWAGVTGTVIGWGSIRESGPQPAILQEVNIPIWSNQECKQKYGHAAPGGIVDHMLCAGRANKDSCSGDSGGPLMVNNGKWTQVGIVSWGIGCGKGQYPGVYTRVERFLPWITKNLKQ